MLVCLHGAEDQLFMEIGGHTDVHEIHLTGLQHLVQTGGRINPQVVLGLGSAVPVHIGHNREFAAGYLPPGLTMDPADGTVTNHSHTDQNDHLTSI